VRDAFVYFAAVYRHLDGRAEAQLHTVAVDFQNYDFDIVADPNGLIRFAAQDEHDMTSLYVV
jgi:hypothetical protein